MNEEVFGDGQVPDAPIRLAPVDIDFSVPFDRKPTPYRLIQGGMPDRVNRDNALGFIEEGFKVSRGLVPRHMMHTIWSSVNTGQDLMGFLRTFIRQGGVSVLSPGEQKSLQADLETFTNPSHLPFIQSLPSNPEKFYSRVGFELRAVATQDPDDENRKIVQGLIPKIDSLRRMTFLELLKFLDKNLGPYK